MNKSRSSATGRSRSSAAQTSEPGADIPIKELRVIWGPELHQPKQYCSYTVGAIEALVEVPPGVSIAETYERTMKQLRALATIEAKRKKEDFWAND